MLIHYIKVAVRHILKYKTQNLISIAGLSVGILCFSICFYCTRFIYDTNKCFTNAERMAEIKAKYHPTAVWGIPPTSTLMEEVQQRFPQEVEAVTYTCKGYSKMFLTEVNEGTNLAFTLNNREVDANFNRVFTPTIVSGSWDAASRTPNAIVLVRSAAERMFGKAGNAIGKRMTGIRNANQLHDSTAQAEGTAYTVQVVIEDIPMNTMLAFMEKLDMLMLNDSEGRMQPGKEATFGEGYVLLRQGMKAKELDARLRSADMKYTLIQDGGKRKDELFVSANNFTGKETQRDDTYWLLALVPAIVGGLILLVGLLNFFQFLVGSFLNRRHEYGIRKAAGGSTVQLFVQLSVQSVLISLFACLVTFCLIELSAPSLHLSLFMFSIRIEQGLLMVHAAQYMGFILLLCLLLSLITAWRVRKVSIYAGIHGGEVTWNKHRLRNVMLGIQFFICWIFTASAVGLYLQAEKTRSVIYSTLTAKEKQHILSFSLGYLKPNRDERLALVERMAQHSGVEDKLAVNHNFLLTPFKPYNKKVNGEDVNVPSQTISTPVGFFAFMHVELLQGEAAQTPDEVVIDQRLAAQLGDAPVGMMLYERNGNPLKVTGVCRNFMRTTVGGLNAGHVLRYAEPEEDINHCYLKCTPGQTDEVKTHVEDILREVLPAGIEPEVNLLSEDTNGKQDLENNLKGIVLFFSIVSIIITLLGVYSAITLDTERRQKEVAIRKINGAGMKQIVMLFARLYITLLVSSAVIAFPFAYMLIYIGKQFWAVHFNSGPAFWCGIFLFITAVTTLTVLFRILKIARINPAEVIKNE